MVLTKAIAYRIQYTHLGRVYSVRYPVDMIAQNAHHIDTFLKTQKIKSALNVEMISVRMISEAAWMMLANHTASFFAKR